MSYLQRMKNYQTNLFTSISCVSFLGLPPLILNLDVKANEESFLLNGFVFSAFLKIRRWIIWELCILTILLSAQMHSYDPLRLFLWPKNLQMNPGRDWTGVALVNRISYCYSSASLAFCTRHFTTNQLVGIFATPTSAMWDHALHSNSDPTLYFFMLRAVTRIEGFGPMPCCAWSYM